ncbi:MAG: hypothetical protein EB039_16220 [Proteobacteria bacterium]|nr:hypothetical protein [Pseudomonadota bacterium]
MQFGFELSNKHPLPFLLARHSTLGRCDWFGIENRAVSPVMAEQGIAVKEWQEQIKAPWVDRDD